MVVKRHCMICGSLIFADFTCPDCQHEITRVRTFDDQSLDEWLDSHRDYSKPRPVPGMHSLDGFWNHY